MQTDYKIANITTYNDGRVVVVARIYEGEVTSLPEQPGGGQVVQVTRYRRAQVLRQVILTTPDLPAQASYMDICRTLNNMLRQDASRTPIPEETNA